jgi:hypothetical protein
MQGGSVRPEGPQGPGRWAPRKRRPRALQRPRRPSEAAPCCSCFGAVGPARSGGTAFFPQPFPVPPRVASAQLQARAFSAGWVPSDSARPLSPGSAPATQPNRSPRREPAVQRDFRLQHVHERSVTLQLVQDAHQHTNFCFQFLLYCKAPPKGAQPQKGGDQRTITFAYPTTAQCTDHS